MRFLAVLAVIALTVYTVIDCVRAQPWERRGLPMWLWILVIIVLPVLGPLTWLISRWSTPRPGPSGGPAGRRGPTAPDDDPDFLAGLNRSDRRGNTGPQRHSRGKPPSDPTDNSHPHDEGHDGGDDDDPQQRGEGRRGHPGTNT